MKYLLYVVCFLFPWVAFAQPASTIDIGGGVGIGSYYGDINQDVPFYKIKPSFSGFMRFNFNTRYSLRVNVCATRLEGQDIDSNNGYQQYRKKSFDAGIVELGLVGEFNFFSYINPPEWQTSENTLYGLLGAGVFFRTEEEKENVQDPVLMMGIGYKQALKNRIALEIEWGFRKTFSDELDGVADPIKSGESSSWFNNDWYNVLEVKLTFNLWQQGGKCRTFEKDSDI